MRNIRFSAEGLLLVIYIVLSILLASFINIGMLNLIKPCMLLVIVIYSFYRTGNSHGRFSNIKENAKLLFIITLFYIILYYTSGLIFGFATSPYSHDIVTIIRNIWEMVMFVVFLEYIRSVLINENKKNIMHVIYTILFIVIELNIQLLLNKVNVYEDLFKYISSSVLPIIFSNIVYSYLTYKGSYKLVLVNRVPILLLSLLVPVFPDHDWFLQGIIGIIYPVIIFVIMKNSSKYRIERSRKSRKKVSPVVYLPLFFIITIFTLFMAGVFKYEPIAIISNSMVPVFYRGDVVVYEKAKDIDLKNIKLYTIIVYNKEGQAIVHRITNKYYENGKLFFTTKGDANNSIDVDPVEEKQVIGVYKFSLKYLGAPSVWLNDTFKKQKAKVEIK